MNRARIRSHERDADDPPRPPKPSASGRREGEEGEYAPAQPNVGMQNFASLRHHFSVNATTPDSSLPSRNSKEAPPPERSETKHRMFPTR